VAAIFEPNAEMQAKMVSGVEVKRVYPRTVGERIGLLRNDLLFQINERPVRDAQALRAVASRLKVGQTLEVQVVRDGQVVKRSLQIERFSRRLYHDRWGGGPFSERRFGFGEVVVHDTLIKPEQCGGPLINLDGRLVGINIARSLRVATFAIPAEQVRSFVNAARPGTIEAAD
jgi:serine protease Do